MSEIILPPRSGVVDDSEEKQFRTALSLPRYISLTTEASQRGGMTVYQLARLILSLYVDKQLLPVKDLPEKLQNDIKVYFKSL